MDGRRLTLSWAWLRDHATDEASFHVAAQQRLVTVADVRAAGAGTASLDPMGTRLIVRWPAGPTAEFPADVLAALGDPVAMYGASAGATSWGADELGSRLTRISFDDFVDTDDGLDRVLAGLLEDGVIVVEGVPCDAIATRRALERFGYLRSTIFGVLWEYSADGGFDDTASTSPEITPHTDGTYSNDAPGLLGLHWHVYEATGGENVFVDSRRIVEQLAERAPAALATLRTVEVPGRYIGDGAHLVARRAPLRFEDGELRQVSYNHHDRAPFLLAEPAMTELYEALWQFDELITDPANQFELGLRPGELVVFDNWRLLHGRRAFDGARHIAGARLASAR